MINCNMARMNFPRANCDLLGMIHLSYASFINFHIALAVKNLLVVYGA